MSRLQRRWSGMGADERRVAEQVVRDEMDRMDASDRLWVEPMLTELVA